MNPSYSCKPFKFDHSWLKNEELCEMIRVFWANIKCPGNLNVMYIFIYKLRVLKREFVSWTKGKTIENLATLQQIEYDIFELLL